jgi:hypothetical protein
VYLHGETPTADDDVTCQGSAGDTDYYDECDRGVRSDQFLGIGEQGRRLTVHQIVSI